MTPNGIEQKNRLLGLYFKYSIGLYRKIKIRIGNLLSELENNGKNNIILFGSGDLCEIACVILSEKCIEKIDIIDNQKAGQKMCGFKIQKESEIDHTACDAFLITELDNFSSIRSNLITRGVPPQKIMSILPADEFAGSNVSPGEHRVSGNQTICKACGRISSCT